MAAESLETLLKARPETGKEDPDYLAALVESLAWLTPEEHAWLTSPREGLHTVLKYLPTPADVHEFIREKRARLEAVKPAQTTYRRLNEEHGPWDQETDYERKKRVVAELLGYNPDEVGKPAKARTLTPPTAEDLASLKTNFPADRPTKALVNRLKEMDWDYIPEDLR